MLRVCSNKRVSSIFIPIRPRPLGDNKSSYYELFCRKIFFLIGGEVLNTCLRGNKNISCVKMAKPFSYFLFC